MGRQVYKTAQGMQIDMDNLRLLNESVVAVGNMSVNARGDQVNPDGSVKTPRNEVMKKTYRTNAVVAGVGILPSNPNKPKTDVEPGTVTTSTTNKKSVSTNTRKNEQETTPQVLRGSLASAIAGPEQSEEPSDDLLSISTNNRTIKRI